MGNQKNKSKPVRSKVIGKTRDNMTKDAEELSATDEEIHAAISIPVLLPLSSGNAKYIEDLFSEEDEDQVSGEQLEGGKQWFHWIVIKNVTQVPPDIEITFDYPTDSGIVDTITLPGSIS